MKLVEWDHSPSVTPKLFVIGAFSPVQPINSYMNNLFTYLDNLPKLPEDLISEIYESTRVFPNIFQYPNYDYYKKYCVTKKLQSYIQGLFTEKHIIGVQVIKNKISIHKDFNRTVAYNYIINSGGEHAETCFYNDKYQLIEKHNIEERRWHRLDVSVFHNVINLVKPRIALTVSPIMQL